VAKPRIIIADTEIEYITRLQLIFVEEFFEKIDLEIITENAYYDELFSVPQKADVLVVSEDLYDSSLHRHNISDIYVMSEEMDGDGTDELNIKRISKYTDRKNIINEIVSSSAALANLNGAVKKDTQIILVTSACGGVGKTTIAMGLAASLEKNHKRVLYINAEKLQTFQRNLNNDVAIISNEVYAKLSAPAGNAYEKIKHTIRHESFGYLPPFKASLMALDLKGDVYEKIAVSAKESKDYDYIIVDTDSGFDEYKTMLVNAADKVIIATNQTNSAVYSTNILTSNINGINSDKYIFICNNFNKDNYNALVSPEMNLRFSVSEYIKVIYNCDRISIEELSKEKEIQKMAFLIM